MLKDKAPLAERMRPKSFDEISGQERLFGKNGILRRMTEGGSFGNMIFYGPSGTGKTTAANIIAKMSNKPLYRLNATTASLSDVKKIVAETESMFSGDILLYLDEIQYFNKKQQQSLLEYVEDGRVTLIASTTENPRFYVYSALLSRSNVFEFRPVAPKDIVPVLMRGMEVLNGENGESTVFGEGAAEHIASVCGGDVRRSLNILESAYSIRENGVLPLEAVTALCECASSNYDKGGDEHYDLLSALQKSIRGSDPDAAVFYLARLLDAGDLISPCRRLMVIASEDIGLAYSQAAVITKACVDSAFQLGLPEAAIPLAHAAVMLATSPKSNSAYSALANARAAIAKGKGRGYPRALQNMHTDGEEVSEKGQFYKYPHDYENSYVQQQYLPDDIKDEVFYEYGKNKNEQGAKAYWDAVKKKK